MYSKLSIDETIDLSVERFIDTMAFYKGYKLGEYARPGEAIMNMLRGSPL